MTQPSVTAGPKHLTKPPHLLSSEDVVIVIVYVVLIGSVALWSLQRVKSGTVRGFLAGSQKMPWPMIGMSLFSNNVGGEHFIGLPGAGAHWGIAISSYEFSAVYTVVLLGWLFMPVYLASQVRTAPEYMYKRLGSQRIRLVVAVVGSCVRVVTKVMTNMYGGSIYMRHALTFGRYMAEGLVLCGAAVLTILGGLESIIWTDIAQTLMMVVGATIVMVVSIARIGGEENVLTRFMDAEPNRTAYRIKEECNKIYPRATHLFHAHDSQHMPWTGVIFGLSVTTVWYWCVDQVMVQRVLSSKNITHAKSAALMLGYMKLFSMHVLVLPGMVARILYPEEIGCGGPKVCLNTCRNQFTCTDIAYPALVTELLPHGLQGFMVTVVLSALITSLTAVFSSTSTSFTVDLWQVFRKNPSQTELLLVGRVFVLVMLVCCLALVPVFEILPRGQLIAFESSIISTFTAPLVAIYVLAMFWERLTEPAAFWSLILGLLIGFARISSKFIFPRHLCGEKPIEEVSGPLFNVMDSLVHNFHHLHFAAIMFPFVLILAILISLFTTPVPKSQLHRLTFWRRHSKSPIVMPVRPISTQQPQEAEPTTTLSKGQDVLPARRALPSQAKVASVSVTEVVDSGGPTPAELIREANLALEEYNWKRANDLCAVLLLLILLGIYGYYA